MKLEFLRLCVIHYEDVVHVDAVVAVAATAAVVVLIYEHLLLSPLYL
jgi:hypothetical protein